jgi:hypothetical protein
LSNSRLWAADPHQFGPGKVHIVSDDDTSKTYCGVLLSACPGREAKQANATCRSCLNIFERRPSKLERERRAQEANEQYERKRAEEHAQWRALYNRHINSPEWRALRLKVVARAGGVCEGCGVRSAAEVHHLTYRHLGAEFLFELRAVCVMCHDRLHERRNDDGIA